MMARFKTMIVVSILLWPSIAYADCQDKINALSTNLADVRNKWELNSQKLFALQSKMAGMNGFLQQAQAGFNTELARLNHIRFNFQNLQAQRGAILNELNQLAQFPPSYEINQRSLYLQNGIQQIELQLSHLQVNGEAIETKLRGFKQTADMVYKDLQSLAQEFANVNQIGAMLARSDGSIAGEMAFFHTPDGRKACSIEQLESVQATIAEGQETLKKLASLKENQVEINKDQLRLQNDLKEFLNVLNSKA